MLSGQLVGHLLLLPLLPTSTLPGTLPLRSTDLAECSLVLLAALLVLGHLALQCVHRLLLLRQLTLQLALLLLLALLALLLRSTDLTSDLLLQSTHLAHGGLVLLAALLVLGHLALQCAHGLMLSGQLVLQLASLLLLLLRIPLRTLATLLHDLLRHL